MNFYVGEKIQARDSEEVSVSWPCTVVTTPVGGEKWFSLTGMVTDPRIEGR